MVTRVLAVPLRVALLLLPLMAAGPYRAGAQGAPPAPPPNPPRLRALDFAPFAAPLATFPKEQAARLDAALGGGATIADVQQGLQARQLTSEALTLYFLDRIRRYDGDLRTYLELNPAALDEARAADARRAAGTPRGPLDGIPVSLKDNIETAGPLHTTAGAELLLNRVAAADAPLVAQLRAAGAVVLGKANLSEFAGVIHFGQLAGGGASAVGGQAHNPYGAYPTLGSSSGSAAGTAARLAMASVGTETSGSLLAPAALNGVVGMKPSRDLVSGAGVVPLLRTNDSAGPIGRSVTDVALLLGAIDTGDADYAGGLAFDALDGVAVGILNGDIVAAPGNSPLLQAATGILVAAGAQPHPAAVVGLPPQFMAAFTVLLSGGVRYDMLGYVAALGGPVKTPEDLLAYNAADPGRRIPFGQDVLAAQAQQSAQLSAVDFAALGPDLRQAAAAALDATFAQKGTEVLVSLENLHSPLYATAGYPAVTVPLGARSGGGLPATPGASTAGTPSGITFIGKPGTDARLLAVAYAFEQASRLRVDPPLP